MSVLLLLIIYLVFISLGLPDSLIGAAWPSISASLFVNESYQGMLTVTVSFFTILSAFMTVKFIKWFTEAGVIVLSIGLTVTGLICYSFAPNFPVLVLCCIPLGLGAGAIDTTLNNYVALHYRAIHLNWLHAFWGVGATLSPFLVSFFLTDLNGWRKGALVLGCIQACILLVSLAAIPLWKRVKEELPAREQNASKAPLSFLETFKIRGVWMGILAFFAYTATEWLVGSWFSSMCVFGLGVSGDVASRWTSYFFFGIMAGRFLSGPLSLKVKDRNMIRLGESIVLLGVILMACAPLNNYLAPFSVVLIGLGCAPIYPAIIHATPDRFGEKLSSNVVSVQMGCGYIATLVINPSFGALGSSFTFLALPYAVLLFLLMCVLGNETVLKLTKDKDRLLPEKLRAKAEG